VLLPVQIPFGRQVLHADLRQPDAGTGLVIFAHGSGSSRRSSRNQFVADALGAHGFATLLLDLLTAREAAVDDVTAEFRFDIPRLGERVIGATEWAIRQPSLAALPIGVFGASTGAAAALIAAATRPALVRAVVSRGGRPDLAGSALRDVEAPSLFLVGSEDTEVIALNRDAASHMRAHVEVELVPGATHLFEEPGTLELVARRAADWFERYLHR
jgi:dienelactone hydrolase